MYLTRPALAFRFFIESIFLPFCTTISHFYRFKHYSLLYHRCPKTANNTFGTASALMKKEYVFTECYKLRAKQEGDRKRQEGRKKKEKEHI